MESFELSPVDVALLSEYLERHEAEKRFLAQQRTNVPDPAIRGELNAIIGSSPLVATNEHARALAHYSDMATQAKTHDELERRKCQAIREVTAGATAFEAQAREIPPDVVAPVELHREQIAHDEHRERDASARMLGWCFLVVGMCAFFALMSLAYKEGWL